MERHPDPPPAAGQVAAGLERLVALIRWLSPPGLSLTSAATLATLERSGPVRLTALAASEGVSQPAMTQLVARLEEAGLVSRCADPADGRAVQVRLTTAGRELVGRRRAMRADRLSGLLARLSAADQEALAAAVPAIAALTSLDRDEEMPPDSSAGHNNNAASDSADVSTTGTTDGTQHE